MPRPFLTAEWRILAMLNWRVPAAVLAPYVPVGTELDSWGGNHYISLVGFRFLRTRLLGVAIPFHRDFDEINLRFYVRRTVGGEERRAVCFLRELVPRVAIAATARLVYNEPYRAVPTAHRIERQSVDSDPSFVEFRWRVDGVWSTLEVRPAGARAPLTPGSEEEFISEHYWGYTRQRDGGTIEYRVKHAPWSVWRISHAAVTGNVAATYGDKFGPILERPPDSAFLADGSPIEVHRPVRVR